jgi:hypothetical protein
MTGGYVICEYDKVKAEFPEFKAVMQALEDSLIAKASADWAPLSYGGIAPLAGQFGKTTVMPQLFADNAGNRLTTWEQTFTATGSQTIMTGVESGGIIPEDFKVGLVGLAFLDKALKISEIKMQISDKKLPRMNIEEAFLYNKPAIIFEEGFILDEKTSFDLYGYVLSQGIQRIKLIGLQVNRIPNKLQVTNTGAALT